MINIEFINTTKQNEIYIHTKNNSKINLHIQKIIYKYLYIFKIFTLLFKFYCLNVKDKIEMKLKQKLQKNTLKIHTRKK